MQKDASRAFNRASVSRRSIKITMLLGFFMLMGIPLLLSQTLSTAGQDTRAAASGAASGKNSCVECHSLMGDELAAPIAAIQDDVHAKRGLSCADCHGGDPQQDDPEQSMNPQKGFVGTPKSGDVARFCGKCHSDADFMKKFTPSLRVDQEAEYHTSVHGKLVKQGDQKPATCISCHGFHGVKAVSDPNAPVYPLNVAQTCGRCHGNVDYMKGYSIATDQLQQYSNSVHAEAGEEAGPVGADLQRLPRQPRRNSARSHFGR
jgi:nitrate/TMAO reductase-like tetraheme cytochrome c subunit